MTASDTPADAPRSLQTVRSDTALSGRDARGRFGPGNPGKPKGARHRATKALETLLEADGQRIARAAIKAALAGDVAAQRLVLERLIPARRPQAEAVHLPAVLEAPGLADKARAVCDAVAAGEIPPDAGRMVLDSLAAVARIAEIAELESRIAALEAAR
jgi:hypothetical protein